MSQRPIEVKFQQRAIEPTTLDERFVVDDATARAALAVRLRSV
jgi:hypothetical protein